MNKINSFLRKVIRFFGSIWLALGSVLFIGLMLAIGALFLFGLLAEDIIEGGTIQFDQSVREYIHRFASPALTVLMQTASFIGSTLFLSLLGIAIVVTFFMLKRPRASIIFIITTVGSSILLVVLKNAFRRARPEPFFNTILPASYSFPSGHSLASFCFYGALAAIIVVRVERLWLKTTIWLAAAFLIALIGISRIYLGVHYPSDVLAGYAVGFIWVMTIAIGDRLNHVRDKSVIAKEK